MRKNNSCYLFSATQPIADGMPELARSADISGYYVDLIGAGWFTFWELEVHCA